MYNLKGFRFCNPVFQAYFERLVADLLPDLARFADVTWAIARGLLTDARTGQTVHWHPLDQALPVSQRGQHFFSSPWYVNGLAAARAALAQLPHPLFVITADK